MCVGVGVCVCDGGVGVCGDGVHVGGGCVGG